MGYRSVAELIAGATGFRLPVDKHVLAVLSTFANYRTGAHANMALKTLARRAAIPRSTLCRALKRLREDRWIRDTRRHRLPTSYDINLDLLKACWTPVEKLLTEAGLRPTGETQLSPTGETPSPVRTDPPRTREEAARGAAPPIQLTFGPSGRTAMRYWRNKHGRRPPLPGDAIGSGCSCEECRAAGVTHLARVKVPPDQYSSVYRWLHGEQLKQWYAERDRALAAMQAAVRRR